VTDALAIWADDVHKSFGDTHAVAGATVSVGRGQIVSLLGPSGSGKTTLLRVVAGLDVPDRGTVAIGGRIVTGDGVWVEPERRRIGMVFQDGALFPHLTVARNVGFGDVREGRVEECLGLVGLADRASSYPHELSGGERQRVALARALAPEPEVVLLDEPFASLDAGLRVALRQEVVAILRAAHASALIVTHDQQEALSVSDAVVVMRDGRVEQCGAPEEVYAHPSSRWVAEFVGDADVLAGTAASGMVDCELGRFATDAALVGAVDVVVRPEALTLAALEGDHCVAARTGGVRATVVGRSFYGADQLVRLRLASGTEVRCRTIGSRQWETGDDVCVEVTGVPAVIVSGLGREDGS
jgi:iron(III) transport system ATP-binding protein